MLLLGGSAVVNALTGVNIYAASFLIPLGVIVYTLAGGLKATFLASYIHSVIGKIHTIKFSKKEKNKPVNPKLLCCCIFCSTCCISHLCVLSLCHKQ